MLVVLAQPGTWLRTRRASLVGAVLALALFVGAAYLLFNDSTEPDAAPVPPLRPGGGHQPTGAAPGSIRASSTERGLAIAGRSLLLGAGPGQAPGLLTQGTSGHRPRQPAQLVARALRGGRLARPPPPPHVRLRPAVGPAAPRPRVRGSCSHATWPPAPSPPSPDSSSARWGRAGRSASSPMWMLYGVALAVLSRPGPTRTTPCSVREAAPVRVLVVSHLYPYPGVDRHLFVHEQCLALRALGVEMRVISPTPWIPRVLWSSSRMRRRGSKPPRAVRDGIVADYPRFPQPPRRLLFDRLGDLAYRRVRDLPAVTGERYDLIHAHQALPDGAVAAHLSRDLGVPYLVTVHGADVNRGLEGGGADRAAHRRGPRGGGGGRRRVSASSPAACTRPRRSRRRARRPERRADGSPRRAAGRLPARPPRRARRRPARAAQGVRARARGPGTPRATTTTDVRGVVAGEGAHAAATSIALATPARASTTASSSPDASSTRISWR